MHTPDQHMILSSWQQSLMPGTSLVDGRSECDRLAFLANFASLVNFYDDKNNINGNWSPFLLKDPVFLLAHISAIPLHQQQSLYRNELLRLQSCSLVPDAPVEELTAIINRLFDQLTDVFMKIERWTAYMQQSFDYDLKKYVLHEVKNTFSEYFWALLSFRDAAYRSAPSSGLLYADYFPFTSYDSLIWKQSKGRRPYWEVLHISEDFIANEKTPEENIRNCYLVLHKAGETIFGFLHTIIGHAPEEYDRIKKRRSPYPDTTLLRVFEKLLRIYQEEQNQLAGKHLEFYYRDILQQAPRLAVADKVYVCANTSGKAATYQLAGGTMLDAGMDAQNQPIQFACTEDICINPATILNAHTLSVVPLTDTFSSVFIQSIHAPDTIVKDEQGTPTGWSTFGGSAAGGAVQLNAGLIVASPMLLLQEGERHIKCRLVFHKAVQAELFDMGNYYLSSKDTWLDITQVAVFTPLSATEIELYIELPASQPPIVPYVLNPEGANVQWPMLKLEFSYFSAPSDPPVLTAITIDVKATKLKNIQLYNDNGGLSAKAPFPLFGNVPMVNSNFIIGSNEIFSKPLQSLYLEMTWDASLPTDFQTYYQSYNDYIATLTKTQGGAAAQRIITQPDTKNKSGVFSWISKALGILFTLGKKLGKQGAKSIVAFGKLIGNFFIDQKIASGLSNQPANTPFNNLCFTVNFSMLDMHIWNPVNLHGMSRVIAPDGDVSFVPYQKDKDCKPLANSDTLLFGTQNIETNKRDIGKQNANSTTNDRTITETKCVTLKGSYFGLAPIATNSQIPPFPYTPNASIQHQTLSYSEQSSTGFIKMTLTGPTYGFGTVIYPNVVADIALNNALLISKKSDDSAKPLSSPANLPFIPKVADFQMHYSASVTYTFNTSQGDYPIQCFSFSPLCSAMVYDNTSQIPVEVSTGIGSLPGAKQTAGGIPLHPAFPYQGNLFLEMDNVIAPAPLNFYFELASSYGRITGGNYCHYSYLTGSGWNSLSVLSDETNQFSCSGIIQVNVPADISKNTVFMGTQKYWISIGVNAEPALFADTFFLKTNGFTAVRSGDHFLSEMTAPVLAASQITRPVNAIPQLAGFIQPFSSLGGKAAENENSMNRRISNRIQTKDRAVTATDYFRLLRQNYADLYYVKTVYDQNSKSTNVYVVRSVENSSRINAYLPLITECMEANMQSFLQQRVSSFASVKVRNFDLQFLQVQAEIELEPGLQADGVTRKINEALNIFLAPWISSSQPQIKIDEGITDAQVAIFISGIDGVSAVNHINFCSWLLQGVVKQPVKNASEGTLFPVSNTTLLVPALSHTITVKQESTVAV